MNARAASDQIEERQKQEALRLTGTLRDALGEYADLDAGQKHDADQCLAGMEERIRSNFAPHKTQFDDLMKAVGKYEPLAWQAIQLGEMFGYLQAQ